MVAAIGVGFALLAAIGLAIQAVFIRIASHGGRVSAALVVGYVMNVAVIVPAALVLYYPDYGLTLTSILAFAVAGLVGSMLGRAFHFIGVERVGASRAEAVKASQSLHAALLAVVLISERLSMAHLGAIVLVVIGLALLATESTDDPLTGEQLSLRSFVFPFAAAVFLGLQPPIAKIGLAEGTPVLVGLAISLPSAGLGFVGYLRLRGALPAVGDLRANLRPYLAAGVGTTLFMVAYYSGLAVAPVNVVVPIIQTSPLLVIGTATLVLRSHERVTPRLVVAAVMVVAGAVGVTLLG